MKTIRRLIYTDLALNVLYVCAGFLALFFFFDLVDQLSSVGIEQYQLFHAVIYVLLQIPGHLYELLPIGVLIGGVLVMARFAQSSEFTVLRTSGLTPLLALKTLLALGLVFVVATFAIGDYLAPLGNRTAQLLKAKYQPSMLPHQTGAWLKEQQGETRYAANIGALDENGNMVRIRIFEFDQNSQIISSTQAARGSFTPEGWMLEDVQLVQFPRHLKDTPLEHASQILALRQQHLTTYQWTTLLNAPMVSVALLKPERMSTYDLFQYIQHLDQNNQSAKVYEIEFWKKVFYPLSCLVMLMLALPFAYLHYRATSLAGYVFAGVVTGISFFLLNNVFGYIGHISNGQPWMVAAAPSLIYFALSLSAFLWVIYKK